MLILVLVTPRPLAPKIALIIFIVGGIRSNVCRSIGFSTRSQTTLTAQKDEIKCSLLLFKILLCLCDWSSDKVSLRTFPSIAQP